MYLYLEKHLAPATINTYVSGVRFYILAHNADVTPFQSVIVRSAKNTVNISYRKVHPRSETVTLPFTIDMILYVRTHFLTDGSIKIFRNLCCINFSLFMSDASIRISGDSIIQSLSIRKWG